MRSADERNSRPVRLVPGIALVELDQAFAVIGRQEPLVFEGESAVNTALPLLRELSSIGNMRAAAQACGVAAEAAEQVVALAKQEGVVEEIGQCAPLSEEEVFFVRARSRACDETSDTSVRRLRNSILSVVGEPGICAAVVRSARESGLKLASDYNQHQHGSDRGSLRPLGIFCETRTSVEDDPAEAARSMASAVRAASGTLPVLVGEACVALGPLLDQRHDGRSASTLRTLVDALRSEEAHEPFRNDLALVGGIAVGRLLALLMRLPPAAALSVIQVHNLARWCTVEYAWSEIEEVDDETDCSAALSYEKHVTPRAYDRHYRREAPGSERAFVSSIGHARVSSLGTHPEVLLHEGADDDGRLLGPGGDRQQDRSSQIGTLLRRTGGLRQLQPRPDIGHDRWCPSGGNLGSPKLYLITLADSQYEAFLYDATRHRLVMIDVARRPKCSVTHRDAFWSARDPYSLVIAASGRALQAKYGRFSLRLAHLDAGCLAAQIGLVADSMGIAAEIRFLRASDPYAKSLQLDPENEAPAVEIVLRFDKPSGAAA
jgi:SagB-type dehydrogenase family enzyme